MTTEDEAMKVLNTGERLYAPVELSHILSLSTETIQRMCREGKIEAFKSGTMWLITKSEVARFIAFGPRKTGE